MFKRRFLAVSAASAVLAASGVLGTAIAANAALLLPPPPPPPIGPMRPAHVPQQAQPGPIPARPQAQPASDYGDGIAVGN